MQAAVKRFKRMVGEDNGITEKEGEAGKADEKTGAPP
jgi:hypothetical protein